MTPVANKDIVLREEFDDWAILFNPDNGETFVLNPVSVFVWKHLDGKHSADDIAVALQKECEGMPENAEESITRFMNELVEKGYAGYEVAE